MATVTITTTGAQDSRIAPAIGVKLRLGRSANAAEVKAYVIRVGLIDPVLAYEQQIASDAAISGVQEIVPT